MGVFQKYKEQLHREDPQQMKRELMWLWGKILQNRWIILMVGALGLLGTVMGLISNVATKYLVDAVVGKRSDLLWKAAVIMVVMMFGGMVFQAASTRISAAVHIRTKNRMQHTTYSRILEAGWEALEPYRSGDLLNRLNSDVAVVCDGVIGFLPNLVSAAAKFVGALCIMLFYDPAMALIALVGVPVTLVLSRVLMGKIRWHNLHMKELTGEVMSFQEDSFRNLTSIKAFAITDRFQSKMHRIQEAYADAYLSFSTFQIGMTSLMSLVSMLVTSLCFGWGVYRLWTGSITYGSLLLFLQLASTLRASFTSLVSLAQQAISITTSAGRVMAVESLPTEDSHTAEDFSRETAWSISLQQVSFRYYDGDTVLTPFDFTTRPGDLIAIIGPSGEGKTTLLRLLLGLVAPCSGTAQLVGDSGESYPINAGTRSAFAYVPQGNSIFAGTIADNLRLVRPEATDEEVEQVLKIACAWEFVCQFPEGIHHRLGAGGRGVSEGQAQRLAIARALLRRAPILLLDEATSGLDGETEKKLLDNMQKSGLVDTCILVTHRSGSADICTRTYEIRNGSVCEVNHGA